MLDDIPRDRTAGIAAAAVTLLVVLLWVVLSGGEPGVVKQSDGVVTYSSGDTFLNVTSMTESRAEFESRYQIQYRGNPVWAEYTVRGVYMGRTFLVRYPQGAPAGEMRFGATPTLNPTDGVPQGYVIPVYWQEADGFGAEVYIDRDFRQRYDRVNIVWGSQRGFRGFRSYNFSTEIVDGVYRDVVAPDDNRSTNVKGMWMVGNFTMDVVRNPNAQNYVGVLLD